jgi:hypothetical protein
MAMRGGGAPEDAEEQRQIWVREFGVELHDWRRAHERGERLLQTFATAAAAVLEAAGPRCCVFAPFPGEFFCCCHAAVPELPVRSQNLGPGSSRTLAGRA